MILLFIVCLGVVLRGETNFELKSDSTTLPFETGFELRYGLGINDPGKDRIDIKWKVKRSIDFFMDFPLKKNWRLEMGFGFSRSYMRVQGQEIGHGNVRMKMLPKVLFGGERFAIGLGGFLSFLDYKEQNELNWGGAIVYSNFYLGPEAFLAYRIINLPHLRSYLKLWGNGSATPILKMVVPNNNGTIERHAFFAQLGLGFTFR
jgi:hypothetical protein